MRPVSRSQSKQRGTSATEDYSSAREMTRGDVSSPRVVYTRQATVACSRRIYVSEKSFAAHDRAWALERTISRYCRELRDTVDLRARSCDRATNLL